MRSWKDKSSEERPHRMYSTDGAGRWWCRTWAMQCPEEVILWGRCQGKLGHAGDHWTYSPCGSYNYAREGAGGGSTPPGHKDWVSPVEKITEYHVSFYTDEEIMDPALIAKLDADDPEVDGSINRPCTQEEIDELIAMGRLDKDGNPNKR